MGIGDVFPPGVKDGKGVLLTTHLQVCAEIEKRGPVHVILDVVLD
jgi:hypothetical protein